MTNFDYQVLNLLLQNRKSEATSLIFEKIQILSKAQEQIDVWEKKIKEISSDPKLVLMVLESIIRKTKIQGIKNLKEKYDMGLKDAKNLYEYIEKQLTKNNIEERVSSNSLEKIEKTTQSIKEEVINYLNDGKKLWAVKFIKEKYDMGLKDAKNYVDAIEKEIF